jgi:hypothetical protein
MNDIIISKLTEAKNDARIPRIHKYNLDILISYILRIMSDLVIRFL